MLLWLNITRFSGRAWTMKRKKFIRSMIIPSSLISSSTDEKKEVKGQEANKLNLSADEKGSQRRKGDSTPRDA
jgi:hypothetical protein